MDGACADCGRDGKLHARGRCQPCYWRAKRESEKEACPGCSRGEKLTPTASGPRCWRCVRRARPRKQPTPRRCRRCGHLRRHAAHGLCNACYQRDPLIVGVWVQGAQARLDERCPVWFGAFADWLLERSAPKVSLRHLRRLEQSLQAGVERPSALIAAISDGGRSGRSPGDAARLLEAFLVARGLVLASDERGRLAHGRRERRIERCPPPLRPAAERYATWLLAGRERARRIGERPLKDHTIEQRLAVLAQFAVHLEQQNIDDWATCSRAHVEGFLATGRDRGFRLAALRDFFRFARNERISLTDPSAGLAHRPARGFRGRTLPRGEQARLLHRWTGGDCHPHETLVGLLALLHGAAVSELRPLTINNINTATRTVTLGRRPHPVPLDPLSFAALERCLEHRAALGTENPHVLVTRGTRAHRTPASQPYLSHALDPAGISPQLLRQTRLAELTHRLDPRLVAAAFGMTPEGALHYLIGAVDSEAAAFANV
ncbi:MAG: tyrosine-type recombinase/integrase [Solirubrobacteraceae bacterium]